MTLECTYEVPCKSILDQLETREISVHCFLRLIRFLRAIIQFIFTEGSSSTYVQLLDNTYVWCKTFTS